MNKLIKKATLALGTCFLATSCIGPNNAFNGVNNWNAQLSDSKFVNELVFLGLNFIPVYPLCLMADYVVFNTVEFWSGKNWIGSPDPYKPQETAGTQ